MNCVSSILKYKRLTTLGWQDISFRKFEFVTKTLFIYAFSIIQNYNLHGMVYSFVQRDLIFLICILHDTKFSVALNIVL